MMSREFSTLERWHALPAGLRVLAVDDDPGSLKTLERMLLHCSYKVTTCMRALDALSLLRESDAQFDILVTEVHMPEMNGLQLLTEIVKLQKPLPVIYQDRNMIMEGMSLGACHFLAKPFKMDVLKLIWQYVLLNTRNSVVRSGQSIASATSIKFLQRQQGHNLSSSCLEESDRSNSNISVGAEKKKKKRFTWTAERQNLFVAALNHLGPKNAVPKKILEYMRKQCQDPGLDRHVISSHLQKFREMNDWKSGAVSCKEMNDSTSVLSTQQWHPAEFGYTTWNMPRADQSVSFEDSIYRGHGCHSYNPIMNEGGGAGLGEIDDDLLLQEFLLNDVLLL